MLRIATIEDLPLVIDMIMKFASSSPYKGYVEEEKIKTMATHFLNAPKEDMIILLSGTDGILVGMATEFPYGYVKAATELAWWVSPNKRGQKAGGELLAAFEFWAKQIGCSIVTVSCLDDKIAKHYENLGYTLQERAYLKEI